MLQCCSCPLPACCDLHAVLGQLPCNAVGLCVVTSLEQQCDAVMNQSLNVPATLYNVDDAAVLLVFISDVMCLACCALSVILQYSGPGCCDQS